MTLLVPRVQTLVYMSHRTHTKTTLDTRDGVFLFPLIPCLLLVAFPSLLFFFIINLTCSLSLLLPFSYLTLSLLLSFVSSAIVFPFFFHQNRNVSTCGAKTVASCGTVSAQFQSDRVQSKFYITLMVLSGGQHTVLTVFKMKNTLSKVLDR